MLEEHMRIGTALNNNRDEQSGGEEIGSTETCVNTHSQDNDLEKDFNVNSADPELLLLLSVGNDRS
jgi:hypothetical protein